MIEDKIKKKLCKDIEVAKKLGYGGINITVNTIEKIVYTKENSDNLLILIKKMYPDYLIEKTQKGISIEW